MLGANGAGKSHFLRLLAGETSVGTRGGVRLGAGVVPGLFHQTHEHPEWIGTHAARRSSTTTTSCAARRWGCCAATSCRGAPSRPFETLSGGQQARFQILLLELSGATLLLLDEPTDNLDLVSAEALEAGLAEFTGTVVAVTHDRWFLRGFDRFVVFDDDCTVTDHLDRPAAWR